MIYTLTEKADSYLEIRKLNNRFILLPSQFCFEKSYPSETWAYFKIVEINFKWLIWGYKFMYRKPRAK